MRDAKQGWWLLAGLTAVCIAMAILQFRWTGELSRGESERRRSDLVSRLELLSRAVDAEFGTQLRALIPDPPEVEGGSWQEAHIAHYGNWQRAAEESVALFRRLWVARPNGRGELPLYVVDDQGVREVEWPQALAHFRDSALARLKDGGRPDLNGNPAFMEAPVFGAEREIEWMLFEMDRAAVGPWLAQLAATNLDLSQFRYSVETTTGDLLSGEKLASPDVARPAFAMRPMLAGRREPRGGRDGRGSRGGRGGAADRGEGRWVVAAVHREGSLEAAVRKNRIRNLTVAIVLLALIAATAIALVRYTRLARETAESERRFFATVSHELRTPLTAIRSASQSIAEESMSEARRMQYAGIIARHSEHLSDLVDQVLYYAASGTRPESRTLGAVDLQNVITRAVEAAGLDLRASGCSMDIDLPGELPRVKGDAAGLRRLFQNLISNAARHAGEGQSIRVEGSTGGGLVEIRVLDRGPGIDDSEMKKIFEPFYRGERARASQTRGAGIGLSLVRDIAAQHRGSVRASNRTDGRGAVFAVKLPVEGEA